MSNIVYMALAAPMAWNIPAWLSEYRPFMVPALSALAGFAVTLLLLFFLKRKYPQPWQKVFYFSPLIAGAVAALIWWLVPVENTFSPQEKQEWNIRSQFLEKSPEWISFHRTWYKLGQYCSSEPVAGEPLEDELLEKELEEGMSRLEGHVLNKVEVRCLRRLARARIERRNGVPINLRATEVESVDAAPMADSDDERAVRQAYGKLMNEIESRFRLLGLVNESQNTERILWEQRERMAKDMYNLHRLWRFEVSQDYVYAEFLPQDYNPADTEFHNVSALDRTLGLLLIQLSSYQGESPEPAPSATPKVREPVSAN